LGFFVHLRLPNSIIRLWKTRPASPRARAPVFSALYGNRPR
jgi:hypothetical protein